eukprot:GHVU01009999.1.p5 GENE.GHVU01009999.1~~GHVU01009999.1.p5  ORF type:complete len:121 (+),score=18.20 GHVU01009999.1:3304-3666(+)
MCACSCVPACVSVCVYVCVRLSSEKERADIDLRDLRRKHSELHKQFVDLSAEKAELRERLRDLIHDWEDSRDDPKVVAMQLHKLKDANQVMAIDNLRQRWVLLSIVFISVFLYARISKRV